MIDWSLLRDQMWEARWDGLVVLGQALWTNVLAHWWFGALLLVILAMAGRKALLRLARFVGVTFVRGGTD